MRAGGEEDGVVEAAGEGDGVVGAAEWGRGRRGERVVVGNGG